jgi:hypothetical protein
MSNGETEYKLQTPLDGKKLGGLFGLVFGVREGESPLVVPDNYVRTVAQVVDEALLTLTPREEKVMRLRFGLNPRARAITQVSVAQHFATSANRIREIERKALRKLRHPRRRTLLEMFLTSPDELQRLFAQKISAQRQIELVPVISTFEKLEPSLIAHLQRQNDDLIKIHPRVFEHLIAEFLASRGFSDVRLVGSNPKTHADIFAMSVNSALNIPQTYFIEVKRWKERIGISVIHEVWGAMVAERERYGWHAAIIITLSGFKDFKTWSHYEVELRGVYLKDRDDLLSWLNDYKQNENGLWLPHPRTDLNGLAPVPTSSVISFI